MIPTFVQKFSLVFALCVLALLLGWVGYGERQAHAVINSGRGMCADTETNILELQNIRALIADAETIEEVELLNRDFRSLETHDGNHIAEANVEQGRESRREQVLSRIETTRQLDEEGQYSEELDELEARAEAAEDDYELSIVNKRIDEIRYEIGITNIATVPYTSGGTTTGGGTPIPASEPLVIPTGGNVITVSNNGELSSALSSAGAGDQIVLQNGSYSGFSFSGSGAAGNPVVIRAANTLGARITGRSDISGSNIWVYGLSFEGSSTGLSVSGNDNYVVANKFEGWRSQSALFPGAGSGLTIAYNEFTNPDPFTNLGDDRYPLRIGIRSSHRDDAHTGAYVHHNYFHNFPPKPGGGYHSGQSDAVEICYTGSNRASNWLFEYNLVENHDGGSAIVDVKCAQGTTVQFNTVRDSPGGRIDFRGGAGGRMIANISINSGGFAVHGENHEVVGNVVEGGGALYLPAGDIAGDYTGGDSASRQAVRNGTFTCNQANLEINAWSSGQYNIPPSNTTISDDCSGVPEVVPLSAGQVGPGSAPGF